MSTLDRREVATLCAAADQWTAGARALTEGRSELQKAAHGAEARLRGSTRAVASQGQILWHLLPITPETAGHLDALGRRLVLTPMTPHEAAAVEALLGPVQESSSRLRATNGPWAFLAGSKTAALTASHTTYLANFRHWFHTTQAADLLTERWAELHRARSTKAAGPLDPRIDLCAVLGANGRTVALTDDSLVRLPGAFRDIDAATRNGKTLRTRCQEAAVELRREEALLLVKDIPVERLKAATKESLRIAPLKEAGIHTVGDVLHHERELGHLPGIGPTSAQRILGVARAIWQTSFEEMPVRLDITRRPHHGALLLRALATWESFRDASRAFEAISDAEAMASLAAMLPHDTQSALVIAASREAADLDVAVHAIIEAAERLRLVTPRSADTWGDFMIRPADYYAMLNELGIITDEDEKTHGELPVEIVTAVRALELDQTHLRASLRGYQRFGAAFACVQKKVIIGDEMGLGKTVEALALMAHLRGRGATHFLVVCPSSVVTNWIRETRSKTTLKAWRLHGPERSYGLRGWIRQGGVAVTTFQTLAWIREGAGDAIPVDLGCVVLDEAHYIKNPRAKRTRHARAVMERAERAVLLTGTPLENRLEEFRNLVGYLRPDLVVDATEFAPARFRRQVAPAYLRRNQEDVLTELPALVEVDQWLPMTTSEHAAYSDAVRHGNFMAMRQASALAQDSAKMDRLVDLVEEAEDSGRRVLVFSYFRDVLDAVVRRLPGRSIGPLTGSVPSARRQEMVDEFSRASVGAALVAQIEAGGVGLNITAASVVIICEPQLKPTVEWQAIARARRMGQMESVQVHRLLSEEGVDRRITEMLAHKQGLFEEFARVSEMAGSAPEALDISDAEVARQVVAEERQRLFGAPG